MSKSLRRRKFSNRLVLWLGAIGVFPLVLLAGITIRGSVSTIRRTAREGLLQTAHQVAQRIGGIVESQQSIIVGMAEILRRPMIPPLIRFTLMDGYALRFPEIQRAALLREDGSVLVSTDLTWNPKISMGEQNFHQLPEGKTTISDLVMRAQSLPTIQLAHKLSDEQVLLAEVSIARLWEVLDDIRVGATGRALLVDSNGKVVAHGSMEGKRWILNQNTLDSSSRAAWPIAGKTGEYTSVDGTSVVGASESIPPLKWTVVVEQARSEAYGATRFLVFALIGMAVLLMLVVAFAGLHGGRRLARPFELLLQAARRVGKGDLDVSVPAEGKDDWSEMAGAFNQMVKELKQLHLQIAVEERMSVLGRIAGELIHDLRHPVRNLQNAALLVDQRSKEPEVLEMFRRVTQREFEGLNRFLGNLEQLVAETKLQLREVDLEDEIESLLESLQTRPEVGSRTFRFRSNQQNIRLETDPFLLRRILQNLLLNAVEASPPGMPVDVSVTAEPLEIRITDSGPGIPSDRIPNLFDAFITTKRRGLGLGLAITKKLVAELGGVITVENSPPRGALFRVCLPVRASSLSSRA